GGEVGRKPVEEVVRRAHGLLDDRDVRVLLLEQVDRLGHDRGALVVAPPRDVELHRLVGVGRVDGSACAAVTGSRATAAGGENQGCGRGSPSTRWPRPCASTRSTTSSSPRRTRRTPTMWWRRSR